MTIHIVRQGDDLESIARTQRIPLWLLLMLNGLSGDETLVPGQSLLILYPQIIHHVRAGDTLYKIARQHHISLRTLYQNNPGLILKPYIYPGDPVVIAYKDAPTDTITVNGYAYPFIPIPLFTETLPYLTGFNSFTYELTNDGRLALPPADEMLSLLIGKTPLYEQSADYPTDGPWPRRSSWMPADSPRLPPARKRSPWETRRARPLL